jgi:hypothetical protein
MTARREETKYLVSAEQGRALMREIDLHLARHQHAGEDGGELPDLRHYVTTIYFDTPSRTLYRAAQGNESHLKLRAKEYYNLLAELTEPATDTRPLVRYQPTLWLELKSREGRHTGKQRIGLPKHDVPAFFARGQITADMLAIQQAIHGAEARDVLEAVAALCASCGQPLAADCLVNYRRIAWQDAAGRLRITLDEELATFRPPADLWTREWALVPATLARETLGPPVTKEKRLVLEIKQRGEVPRWLLELLDARAITRARFSKFEAASSATHKAIGSDTRSLLLLH